MPYAVTHVLAGLISADMVRDHAVKNKRSFPLHLVFFSGIASLIPDMDMIIYYAAYIISGTPAGAIHRQFTHTIFLPAILAIITAAFYYSGKQKHAKIMAVATCAIGLHILLDAVLAGYVYPLYPLSSVPFGLDLFRTGTEFGASVMAGLDAILLLFWLFHEETAHKISDFI
jgi:membrane-bound metal-dependent hydrolase YbcI (DUF457 family)